MKEILAQITLKNVSPEGLLRLHRLQRSDENTIPEVRGNNLQALFYFNLVSAELQDYGYVVVLSLSITRINSEESFNGGRKVGRMQQSFLGKIFKAAHEDAFRKFKPQPSSRGI
jgi:hypothetical protein